ncbi:hypothetical protein NliqN6_2742 [Naganishia liquefaciens]|uniref:Uncharacterized protein n=1 Tax=Naganishia liquefaciens TaxID=104408 RepID=A0A8H3TTF0_9TREE|nr:hypothetical protein NliqN6_2742 [Naganishia liquefaciens]
MAHPHSHTHTTRFTLDRYSVPDPGKGPSPAKIRNSTLDWMHYEGHEDAPLGIVVEESSSEEGFTRGETCVVRIVQAGNQHRQFSLDAYRDAYDVARGTTDDGRAPSLDGCTRGGEVVDTIKLTVKPPSVAVRLLHPLGQLRSRHHARIRPAGDYTYDRFQLRFTNAHDIPAFLAILHRHFPALNDSHTGATQMEIEHAGSIALSQGTCPYMPDDPYRAIRRPGMDAQNGKRRRMEGDGEEYGARSRQIGSVRVGEGKNVFVRSESIYGRDLRFPESSYAWPSPGMDVNKGQPSYDQDGFVKPLAPAYIDTPTPANRIYHLGQLDPNQRRERGSRSSTTSPKKMRLATPAAINGPFQNSRYAPESGWRGSTASIGYQDPRSAVIPPFRQPMSCPPFSNESVESRPTGYTLPSPPGVDPVDAQTCDSSHARTHGYARPEPRILATETVSNVITDQGASPKRWPAVYGRQSSGSRATMSAVQETPGFHRTDALRQDALVEDPDESNGQAQQTVVRPLGPNANHVPDIAEDHHESGPVPRDGPIVHAEMPDVATHLTAQILRSSSLYALSFDELEDAIDEIIMEEGFIPFVEKIERSWRKRLERLSGPGQQHDGNGE